MIPALLALEDGSLFLGQSIGVEGSTVGEVVFNTAMTGYQEILTDPSYAQQIVTLTYPQIGNTGVNSEDDESDGVWSAGLVIRQTPRRNSNWRQNMSLPEYLVAREVVAIADVDTRRLTKLIREKGALAGCIVAGVEAVTETGQAAAIERAKSFPGLKGMDLAKVVTGEERNWTEGTWTLEGGYQNSVKSKYNVVAYDFGVKRNILRLLADRGCDLTIVPAQTPASAVMAMKPDGIFLSNGPGDPEPCEYAIEAIKTLLETGVPIFGICLGHQLLALASGAQTIKMSHGHHGANHPVQDQDSEAVIITSQNHGFAVDAETLPKHLRCTHISLFDGTVQGIERTDVSAFGFQGHPEASPGPQDCVYLFDKFIRNMDGVKEV
ncbi:MAG: glutamine-hydrolyzing carbamoyl-phosphate synthase small subunit [Pseudomonadales bacterium]|nr:glutamine-hydrolyzing carbamoyl-phosphate synthase small subunit [Pseudomonadales bacterium]